MMFNTEISGAEAIFEQSPVTETVMVDDVLVEIIRGSDADGNPTMAWKAFIDDKKYGQFYYLNDEFDESESYEIVKNVLVDGARHTIARVRDAG